MREEFDADRRQFATPRITEIAPAADGIEDEDLIEREDMVVTVTMGGYIKRTPLDDLPRPEARRQGPRRHGDQGRGCGHRSVRHLDAHAGPVLLDRRQGLSPQGLAPARGRAAGARPADGQPAAAGGGRDDLDRAAAARGRGGMGQAPHHVRDRPRHRAPQQHGRLHQHPDRAARSRCASARTRKAMRATG